MTLAELLEVVYRFHPRGLPIGPEYEATYEATEESERQREAVRQAAAAYGTWRALLARLEDRYPDLFDDSLSILAGWRNAGYSGWVGVAGHPLWFHVSLFGPYYGIARKGIPGEEAAARDVAEAIEVSYPGFQPIAPELGSTVVPDVGIPGQATIFRCLLDERWPVGSGPLPPRSRLLGDP